MRPQSLCLLHTYWDRLTMVSYTGAYYGAPFKSYRGVTQVDPLSPILFNVVVGTLVQSWVFIVVGGEAGLEGWGREIHWRAAFCYLYYGIIALTWTERLQGRLTPSRAVQPVGNQNECGECSWYNLPVRPCRTKTPGRGIWAADDGREADILGPPETSRPVTGLCGGPVCRFSGSAPPYVAQGRSGCTMGDPPWYNLTLIEFHSRGRWDRCRVRKRDVRDGRQAGRA